MSKQITFYLKLLAVFEHIQVSIRGRRKEGRAIHKLLRICYHSVNNVIDNSFLTFTQKHLCIYQQNGCILSVFVFFI